MPPVTPPRIVVELAGSESAPEGRVIAPDGTVRPFASWLELLSAMQAAVGGNEDPIPRVDASNERVST